MAITAPAERFNFASTCACAMRAVTTNLPTSTTRRLFPTANSRLRVGRFAAALTAQGIRREERVLLLMHDCTDWPVAFLPAACTPVVPVAVNTLLTADDYANAGAQPVASSDCFPAALLPTLRAAMAKAQHEIKVIVVSRGTAHAPDETPFAHFINDALVAPPAANTHRDDIGFWLLLVGLHRSTEGHRAYHANLYWTAELYAAPVLGPAKATSLLGRQAVLRLRPGNALSFPLSVAQPSS